MAWDWEKTLSDIGESIADIFKLKYGTEYAERLQPTVVSTYKETILPTILIIGLIVILLVKKW